jgi:hypothetical protein
MEDINNILELSRESSVEQFALRVRDLTMATNKV